MWGMSWVWIWLIVAVVMAVIELLTPSALVCIWFTLGACIAMLLAFLKFSLPIQIIGFLVVSILAMAIVRPIASRYLRGNIIPTNADRMIGQVGTITKAIQEDQWGEVYVLSTYWSAVSKSNESIPKGKKVKVLAIEGAKLIVEAL